MRKIHRALTPLLLATVTACTHPSTLDQVTGTDRDEHGCLASAGYVWSAALHDCVRLWEVGTRFNAGQHSVFLVYSADSTYAEIFIPNEESVICRRRKKSMEWGARSGETVTKRNGVTVIRTKHRTFTDSGQ